MRYGISPAERNTLEANYKVASSPDLGERELPRIPGLNPQERAEQHEARLDNKKRLYGKMRHRVKPSPF